MMMISKQPIFSFLGRRVKLKWSGDWEMRTRVTLQNEDTCNTTE